MVQGELSPVTLMSGSDTVTQGDRMGIHALTLRRALLRQRHLSQRPAPGLRLGNGRLWGKLRELGETKRG